MRRIAPLALLAACGGADKEEGEEDLTVLRVSVTFDAPWGIGALEVAIGDETWPASEGAPESGHSVALILDDALAGSPIDIEVWGLSGGARIAWGVEIGTPVLHDAVAVTIALTRLPCGDFCIEGATQCAGDGVATCERSEGCLAWSDSTPCSKDAPFCSLGLCATTCVDECAAGARMCDGAGAWRECGNVDSGSFTQIVT